MADELQVSRQRIGGFKRLALAATVRVQERHADLPKGTFGMLLDGTYGRDALFGAADHGLWIGRPVEEPGSRPLDFEGGGSLAGRLIEWPLIHTIKCLAFYHPGDPAELRAKQDRELLRLSDAARTLEREFLVEIIAGKHGELHDDTIAAVLAHLYGLGIRPDWWKLEPQQTTTAWNRIAAVMTEYDPSCRGILMLGLEAPESALKQAFVTAAPCAAVRGFAVGRSIFAEAARRWLSGEVTDAAAIEAMAASFGELVDAWLGAKRG
jgi:5-dehydro-2-deoxygluconokinase